MVDPEAKDLVGAYPIIRGQSNIFDDFWRGAGKLLP
jgi:hypothetical protein